MLWMWAESGSCRAPPTRLPGVSSSSCRLWVSRSSWCLSSRGPWTAAINQCSANRYIQISNPNAGHLSIIPHIRTCIVLPIIDTLEGFPMFDLWIWPSSPSCCWISREFTSDRSPFSSPSWRGCWHTQRKTDWTTSYLVHIDFGSITSVVSCTVLCDAFVAKYVENCSFPSMLKLSAIS